MLDTKYYEKYKKLSNTYKVYLACNNGVKNIDKVNNENIVELDNSKLVEFIKKTPVLILPRLKFLVVYNKHQ